MSHPQPAGAIDAQVQGEISGQLAIGNHIIQIGSVAGGVVNITPAGMTPRVQPHPTPIHLTPRPFNALLDRQAEIAAATAALQKNEAIEFWGEDGLGKTVLLRKLAGSLVSKALSDGIVYLAVRRQPVDDILQFLWDAFYDRDVSYKPTDARIRHDLHGKQALILLDDVELERDETQTLLNVAPGCMFCLVARERHLWGDGTSLALTGLPAPDGMALMERELGRALTPQERPAAHALCAALRGHPLYLLRAATIARENRRSLIDIARQVRDPAQIKLLNAWALNALSPLGQQIIAVLAAFEGTPIQADDLAKIIGRVDIVPELIALQQRGLVQAHSPRYTLTGPLGEQLRQTWDVTPWEERALTHFTLWAEAQSQNPQRIVERREPLLQVLSWAMQARRWKEVMRLGRAIEAAFALGGSWGAWARVLQAILQAARLINDRSVEAWALHQLGSRALCLGEITEAGELLKRALQIRQAIGDQAGIAVTQHNLNVLAGPPAPPQQPPKPPKQPAPTAQRPARIPFAVKALVVIVIIVAIGVGIWASNPPATPTPIPPPPIESPQASPVPPQQPTATATPVPTASATSLPLPADTSTPRLTDTPRPTSLPSPQITLNLSPLGCNAAYKPGDSAQIQVWMNRDADVSVSVNGQLIDQRKTFADQMQQIPWQIPPQPGSYTLRADSTLDNVSGPSSECQITVADTIPPDLSNIDLASLANVGPKTICPDKVQVKAQVTDLDSIARVELRYRTLPATGVWLPLAMTASDPQNYWINWRVDTSPDLKSYEFMIYAEDSSGNGQQVGPYQYLTSYYGIDLPHTCYAFYVTPGMDRQGADFQPAISVSSSEACMVRCQNYSACVAFTYDVSNHGCWIKDKVPALTPKSSDTSGMKIWPP